MNSEDNPSLLMGRSCRCTSEQLWYHITRLIKESIERGRLIHVLILVLFVHRVLTWNCGPLYSYFEFEKCQ